MNEKDLDKVIQVSLSQIGVPHNLKGYRYIVYAIKKGINDRDILNYIVKGLYISIAEENGDKSSRVERAIRHAIEVCWKRGNANVINKMFGYTVDSEKGRPTNSEFISYMCDFISIYGEDILNQKYEF